MSPREKKHLPNSGAVYQANVKCGKEIACVVRITKNKVLVSIKRFLFQFPTIHVEKEKGLKRFVDL